MATAAPMNILQIYFPAVEARWRSKLTPVTFSTLTVWMCMQAGMHSTSGVPLLHL